MNKKIILRCLLLIILLNLQWIKVYSSADERPLIFPIPGDIRIKAGNFIIDKSTFIFLPEKPLKSDIFLGDLLFAEFSDKFEQPVLIKRAAVIPANGKYFLMGDLSNPLVKKYCMDNNLLTTLTGLGSEGYILSVTEKVLWLQQIQKTELSSEWNL